MKNITAVLLLFIIFLSSCKKDKSGKDANLSTPEFAFVDSYEESDSSLISEYTYGFDQVYLIIHTDATSDKYQFKDGAEINRFFFNPKPQGRGWKNPGYFEWLSRDCVWYQLKYFNIDCFIEPSERTNGAKGYNSISVHIAYSSAIPKSNPIADTRTPCQKKALEDRVRLYKSICPNVIVMGHRDLPGVTKSCPNFNVKQEYAHID